MGHCRGRAAHKARKKRRKELERWHAKRARRGVSPLLQFVNLYIDTISLERCHAAFEGIQRAVYEFGRACACAANVEAMTSFFPRPDPDAGADLVDTTLDELRDAAGIEGSIPRARFTAEGGFTLN